MLLPSYMASYVSPEKLWPLAFFGLIYPVLILINLFFMLFWLLLGKKYFLLSLITILLGFSLLQKHVQFNSNSMEKEGYFKVMSYNTRLFDHYNWYHSEESKNLIIDYLHEESPDILCLQEFFSDDNDKYPILKKLRNNNKAKYSHIDYFLTQKKSKHYGLATFSSFPIIAKGKIQPDVKSNNYTIFTDILYKDDTIRIFNIHLPSIRFQSKDFLFISEITSTDKNTNKQEFKKSSLSVIKKLKIAFQKRARHVEIISGRIAESPYPVIVCGDFNDTPSSYAYHTISNNLVDCFIESGLGFGKTYIGNMPSFRIDYILHDKRFTGKGFETSDIKFSDHYPVSTYLKFVE